MKLTKTKVGLHREGLSRPLWLLGFGLSLLGLAGGGPARAVGHLGAVSETEGVPPQPGPPSAREPRNPWTVLIGLGDSLTHGTGDAAINSTNTLNAYLQKVADSLAAATSLMFSQPLFDERSERLQPFRLPTNLAVDGADAFSLEGLQYYKRAGVEESFVNPDLLCDRLLPRQLKDKYDKVLYPINLLAGAPVSQIDSAIWLLNRPGYASGRERALVIFWIGNNDSSTAALGAGGENPSFQPIPLDQIAPEITPALRLLLRFGERSGDVSFAPYSRAAINRNLTDRQDFLEQYERLLTRLETEASSSLEQVDLFLLTLPYYSAVGYLFDSEDLEFYLQKVNPAYTVPRSFKRVAPPGKPIRRPLKGDRISLLTFGFMYALLNSGYSVEYVNQILEQDGRQHDGLVLSEKEQQFIMSRIDDFNAIIRDAAAARGARVHLVDIGQFLNDALTGKTTITVGGRQLTRKWVRGGGFSLDGVHPGYTAHALIANFVLANLNEALGLEAPLYDLSEIAVTDPYLDRDEDGWAPGPSYRPFGITELLFLFKDQDDADPTVQAQLPPDVWEQISNILLRQILGIPALRKEAERLGIAPPN